MPAGPKIAFRGGLDFNDHRLIWDKLDRVHTKHPDMVLLHGGSPRGAELIAGKWADNRKVPQIAFKPDWSKHAKQGGQVGGDSHPLVRIEPPVTVSSENWRAPRDVESA